MQEKSLNELIAEAQSLIDQNENDQAIDTCLQILSAFPQCILAYGLLGKALFLKNQINEAQAQFQRVLGVDPENLMARIVLGAVFAQKSQIEEAIWHLERARELSPGDADLQDEINRLRWQKRLPEDKHLVPNEVEQGRDFASRGEWQKAIREYQHALEKEPNRLDILGAIIEAGWKAGDDDLTEKASRELLTLLPMALKANLALGMLAQKNERMEEAESFFEVVRRIDPTGELGRRFFGEEVEGVYKVSKIEAEQASIAAEGSDIIADKGDAWQQEGDSMTQSQPEERMEGEPMGENENISPLTDGEKDIPDWLNSEYESASQPSKPENVEPSQQPILGIEADSSPDEELPDWLKELQSSYDKDETLISANMRKQPPRAEQSTPALSDGEQTTAGESGLERIQGYFNQEEPQQEEASIPDESAQNSPAAESDEPLWLRKVQQRYVSGFVYQTSIGNQWGAREKGLNKFTAGESPEIPPIVEGFGESEAAPAAVKPSPAGEETVELPPWVDQELEAALAEEMPQAIKEETPIEDSSLPWLQELDQTPEETPITTEALEHMALEPEQEEEVPFINVEEIMQQDEVAGTLQEEEIPEWLREAQPSGAAEIAVETAAEVMEQEPIAAEAEVSPPVVEEEAVTPEPEQAVEAEPEGAPDWLSQVTEGDEVKLEPVSTGELQLGAMPEWLAESFKEETPPIEEMEEISSEPEIETVEKAEIPDWLQQFRGEIRAEAAEPGEMAHAAEAAEISESEGLEETLSSFMPAAEEEAPAAELTEEFWVEPAGEKKKGKEEYLESPAIAMEAGEPAGDFGKVEPETREEEIFIASLEETPAWLTQLKAGQAFEETGIETSPAELAQAGEFLQTSEFISGETAGTYVDETKGVAEISAESPVFAAEIPFTESSTVAEQEPDSSRRKLDLAHKAVSEGENVKALELYSELLPTLPKAARILPDLEVLARASDTAHAYQLLGDAQMKEGNLAEALQAYRSALTKL